MLQYMLHNSAKGKTCRTHSTKTFYFSLWDTMLNDMQDCTSFSSIIISNNIYSIAHLLGLMIALVFLMMLSSLNGKCLRIDHNNTQQSRTLLSNTLRYPYDNQS